MNHSRTTRRRLGNRGTSTIEFAIFALAITGMVLCGVDIVSYVRVRLKLDEASNSVASLVSGYQDLYKTDFPTFYQMSQQTVGSIDVTGLNVVTGQSFTPSTGATIITAITNPSGVPTVAWQRQIGNPSFTSSIGGAVGAAATKIPDNYVVPQGSSVIAVEVIGTVSVWVLSKNWVGNSGPSTLNSIALLQPRASLLSQINPGDRPS